MMSDVILARAKSAPSSEATPTRERAYDPARLRRGAQLGIERLGPAQFAVQGSKERVWHVNLDLDTPCSCPDAQFRGRGCKHELISRLANGDLPLILALGTMLAEAEDHADASR